jgi:hypothetical protein
MNKKGSATVKKGAETVSVTIRFPRDLHKQITAFSGTCSPSISFNSAVLRLIHYAFEMEKMTARWETEANKTMIQRLTEQVSELVGILKKQT